MITINYVYTSLNKNKWSKQYCITEKNKIIKTHVIFKQIYLLVIQNLIVRLLEWKVGKVDLIR